MPSLDESETLDVKFSITIGHAYQPSLGSKRVHR
jgi:hypothetical protein